MNNYEEWAQLVAKNLKGEADLITAIGKDELDDRAATEAFMRAVLEPFIPENFGIGSGRVVDAFGTYSDHLDIIIYNRDFPRIGLRGAHSAYLYESVLATFVIRAKFVRKTFFESLDACASIAELSANIDPAVLVRLAKKNGLQLGPNKTFTHEDPLRTARFHLIGRPPAFVFGFSGIKNSYRQLQQNIELWFDNRRSAGLETEMKALPAVIATQGCFAWRNAAPLALSNRDMLGIGNDSAPVRLIVLQLLYLLNRRLNVTADGYGIRPSLKAYLSQFTPPKFEIGICNVAEVVSINSDAGEKPAATFESAMDHSAKPAAVEAAKPEPVIEIKERAPKTTPLGSAPIPGLNSEPVPAENAPKTPPLGSAPIPGLSSESAPADNAPKTTPLGSAPIPPMKADNTPKAAPLGSAPIPAMANPEPVQSNPPTTAPLGSAPIPEKPPVDIDFGNSAAADEVEEEAEDPFESTMIIPPPNANGNGELKKNSKLSETSSSRSSTDAFIARVKEQLSASGSMREMNAESEQDPFTSTIPQ